MLDIYRGATDAKKLKDKIAHTGLLPGDEFMAQVSLLADAKYQVYDHNLILVGGDGATWIKEGALHKSYPTAARDALAQACF